MTPRFLLPALLLFVSASVLLSAPAQAQRSHSDNVSVFVNRLVEAPDGNTYRIRGRLKMAGTVAQNEDGELAVDGRVNARDLRATGVDTDGVYRIVGAANAMDVDLENPRGRASRYMATIDANLEGQGDAQDYRVRFTLRGVVSADEEGPRRVTARITDVRFVER